MYSDSLESHTRQRETYSTIPYHTIILLYVHVRPQHWLENEAVSVSIQCYYHVELISAYRLIKFD